MGKRIDWERRKMLFLPDTWLSSFYKLILLFNVATDKAGVDQRNATLSPTQYPGYNGSNPHQYLYKGRWWPIQASGGQPEPEFRCIGCGQPDIAAEYSQSSSGAGLCQLP